VNILTDFKKANLTGRSNRRKRAKWTEVKESIPTIRAIYTIYSGCSGNLRKEAIEEEEREVETTKRREVQSKKMETLEKVSSLWSGSCEKRKKVVSIPKVRITKMILVQA